MRPGLVVGLTLLATASGALASAATPAAPATAAAGGGGYLPAADVQADTAHQGELDALTLRTNAAREAWGYQVEAGDIRKRAQITRQEGRNIIEAGKRAQSGYRISAIGGLATDAGGLLMQRYGLQEPRGG